MATGLSQVAVTCTLDLLDIKLIPCIQISESRFPRSSLVRICEMVMLYIAFVGMVACK